MAIYLRKKQARACGSSPSRPGSIRSEVLVLLGEVAGGALGPRLSCRAAVSRSTVVPVTDGCYLGFSKMGCPLELLGPNLLGFK